MNIKNKPLLLIVVLNWLHSQENYMPLELNNDWTYDYTFEIESVTGELDDFIVTTDEYKKVMSLDNIGNYYAYKIDEWQQDSTLVGSEWFTQNDSGLFSVAYYYSNASFRSEVKFKFVNKSFNSIKKLYFMLVNSAYRDTIIHDTTRMILQYPLSDSSSWIWFNNPWLAVRTVEGDERIETTAGIFECKRIRIDYDLTNEIVFYEWWSQDVGMIKRDVSFYNMIHIDENGDSLGLFNSHMYWELKETNLLVNINDSSAMAYSYKVYPAYPNPFNPVTTIRYELPIQTDVRLSIYNIMGQEVETLVNGKLVAGEHEVVWNAGNLSSGIYFYRLETPGKQITKKLVVLK